jgi:SfnB family sulfur acquisition oxidoreductase
MAAPPIADLGRIATDQQAIEAAHRLAVQLAPGAIDRDRDRTVPTAELEAVAASGLLAITLPTERGGAAVSIATVVEVLRTIAVADPSIAQTLLPHYVIAGGVTGLGSDALQERIAQAVLGGGRIGNGVSERGTKHAWSPETRAVTGPDGRVTLTGSKYYATGALTAAWIGISALDDADRLVLALVPRDAQGLAVGDEWTSFGQRSTISGPATLDGVTVSPEDVLPLWQAFEGPTIGGAIDQILHAAIDVGIARAALEDGAEYVRTRARPWFESDAQRAADEPAVIQRFGQLAARVSVAEAALRDAAAAIDATASGPLDDDNTAELSIAVAAAKVFAGEVAVEVSSAVFELAGTSATDARHGLDRHWRNARTHTLHDPVRWKHHHIGNHQLNGVRPPRHSLI